MNKLILLLLLLISLVPIGCNETEEVVDAQSKVYAFLNDMNPEFHRTMLKMSKEIALADKKIQQLYELKGMYPNQREMINQSLKQWQGLRKDLNSTWNRLYEKVEGAYVAYKIDEIQGRKKFSAISQKLLNEANAVLANAETTKSLIEEQLNE
ncbi:MAG: hypothetical protein DRR19_08155 [Candidatus Parabeggiatoa sp. nov. 1]|nr:MAG: hypothetical protein DRR19_08155 [Gammaproteobacteria bacterium]